MIPRHLAATVERAATQYPVVSVNGPRQSGKTTLLRRTFPGYRYVSLESPDERAFALEDPRGFLGRFDGPVILDEAQRAPDLFSYIQTIVDAEPAPGRFLLSGSRNFLLLRSISQSLAGRVRLACLLPFSLAELSVLDASFVIFLLPPYHRSFNKRLTKRARLYFVDTGLLCWLLRIRNAERLASHAARGAVFENLVIAETLKAGCNAGERPDLYHWRDQRGNEIDLLVETPDGPHAVELKSGETVGSDFFRGLARWRTLAEGSAPATLVYGGTESYARSGVDVRAWRDWA